MFDIHDNIHIIKDVNLRMINLYTFVICIFATLKLFDI